MEDGALHAHTAPAEKLKARLWVSNVHVDEPGKEKLCTCPVCPVSHKSIA